MRDRILILGGTAEAAALARRLVDEGETVITSLAGRLPSPPSLAGQVRVGGFGGVDGLAAWLAENAITRVIDATHPFAAVISAHAAAACARLGLPLRRLERPVWRKHPGDRWHWADSLEMAARMAPGLGRRILLTVGAGSLAPFTRFGGPFYLLRLLAAPAPLAFPRYRVVIDRGPFVPADEMALMRRFAIDLLVSKASGGAATEAKIIAARRLGLRVLLVGRP
ncbi:MAG TPA: cobalt-precorrin-6A reductase [Rhodospirillaceae bacterium]|nr:cobalt-precorrin-6A reductase [Rhodospirillaceae bacterium]